LYGLREVAKSVNVQSSKAIIIAPNIEQIESEGGLDDRIAQIIAEAKENNIPVVFALTKRRIGSALGVQGFISMVSILDYNGADDEFNIALKHAAEGRALYAKAQTQSAQTDTDVDIVKVQQLPSQQSENKSTLNIQAEAFTRQQFAR
jgi:ribosomal protein L7Ae-like RNA K-turn-binding protein